MTGASFGLLLAAFAVAPECALAQATYYVATTGNDSNTALQAQNPSTPWKTIKNALGFALPGDTIKVAPGTYGESVESKQDGNASAPITLQSAEAGGAVIQPPLVPDNSGNLITQNGFFISHNYHTIIGFKVTGGSIGIRLGAHDGAGNLPVVGVVVKNNEVVGNSSNGIQVSPGTQTEIALNTVHDNGIGASQGNGISYSGGDAISFQNNAIHDNVVYNHPKKGILIAVGTNYTVYDNFAHDNGQGPEDNLSIQQGVTLLPTPAETYYVDCLLGDDSRSPTDAKNTATPWLTIKNALLWADGGDTVMVIGGTTQAPRSCAESEINTKKDGGEGKLITIKAATPGAVIIDPPASGNGFLIKHSYNAIDGFNITGASNGIQVNGSGSLTGVVITGNFIHDNGLVGIKIVGSINVTISNNVIYQNLRQGITYDGARGTIFNNLVYFNGIGPQQGFGIEVSSGNGHKITNNTVYSNISGGIRLGANSPVYATVVNNILVGNHVGIKEPAGSSYQGIAKLEFNDVVEVTPYDLSGSPAGSVVGATSMAQDPRFVSTNSASPDFLKLSARASGQAVNSPCIDKGSASVDALSLGNRSTSTNNAPDTGQVDLGYHWPAPTP